MHLSKKVACVALCVAQTTYAFPGITRRATTQAATPSTIDIPLLFDSNGRYVMTVNIVCSIFPKEGLPPNEFHSLQVQTSRNSTSRSRQVQGSPLLREWAVAHAAESACMSPRRILLIHAQLRATNSYNQSASTTAKALNGNESVSLVGGTYSGSVIKEDCTVDTTGSPWAYKNQTSKHQYGTTPAR